MDRADKYLQSCLELHQAHHDLLGECDARFYLGWILFQHEDFDAAREQGEKALALSHELGLSNWKATHWSFLGLIAQESGNLTKALICFEEALRLYKSILTSDVGTAEENIGYVHLLSGNFEEARKRFISAYKMYWELYFDPSHVLNLADSVAALACATEEYATAARLNAMSTYLREQSGFARETYIRKAAERNMARTREVLGDAAFQTNQDALQGFTLEETMRYLGEWLGVQVPQ